ncbi:MAG: glyoxylate/hydroxypyruvate reductase A [Rhizobiales bacterium NRL2]|jgi:glyoxylate/hydroxypyruvate reductase A|nr:MAG: glyoxylate/hydroxypyruvate reductase A [Rhizobiales bacterium NRL2]
MTVLLFASHADRDDWWRETLLAEMPDLDFRTWPETGDVAEVEYALVWKPETGLLAGLPNLRAIFSLGAGVDHIFADTQLPEGVPICRVVNPNMALRMREWVVMHVLMHHRRHREYDRLQKAHEWRELPQPHAGERRVGVMGLGELGGDAAKHLGLLGFDVAGWSRTPKAIDGVTGFHGGVGLKDFLARTEILVCLLPLTPATEGIVDAALLSGLPRGATFINAGRGGHVVEEDLLAALDSGQIGEATLDVFRTEPLPAGSPFWDHPRVTVTPHIAAFSDPRALVDQVIGNIRRDRAGEPLLNTVDPKRGY